MFRKFLAKFTASSTSDARGSTMSAVADSPSFSIFASRSLSSRMTSWVSCPFLYIL